MTREETVSPPAAPALASYFLAPQEVTKKRCRATAGFGLGAFGGNRYLHPTSGGRPVCLDGAEYRSRERGIPVPHV